MNKNVSNSIVGYVVPTIGRNLDWLNTALESIRTQSHPTEIIVVIPKNNNYLEEWLGSRKYLFIYESQNNLANALNTGIGYLNDKGIEIFGFIGDDDILALGSIHNLFLQFENKNTVAAVGHCWYIDAEETVVFHNRAYPGLVNLMTIIPNVIPHPGALMRTKDWDSLGGFDEGLPFFGMDLDYWLRLRKLGKIKRVECPMSYFRWHDGGLTGGRREESKAAAISIRKKHSKGIFYLLNRICSPLITKLGEAIILRNNNKIN